MQESRDQVLSRTRAELLIPQKTTQQETSTPSQPELSEDFKSFFSSKLDKIQLEISGLRASVDALHSDLSSIKEKCEENSHLISLNSRDISDIQSKLEVLQTKSLLTDIQMNNLEQRERSVSFRLFNFPLGTDGIRSDARATCSKVYEDIMKPAFTKAVEQNKIDSVPTMDECVEFGHTLGPKPSRHLPPGAAPVRVKREPTIIIKMRTRFLKTIFFQHKKSVLQGINRGKEKGSLVGIAEDMTRINYTALNRHKDNKDVKSIFMQGGKLRCILENEPDKSRILHNPFAKDIFSAISEPKVPES